MNKLLWLPLISMVLVGCVVKKSNSNSNNNNNNKSSFNYGELEKEVSELSTVSSLTVKQTAYEMPPNASYIPEQKMTPNTMYYEQANFDSDQRYYSVIEYDRVNDEITIYSSYDKLNWEGQLVTDETVKQSYITTFNNGYHFDSYVTYYNQGNKTSEGVEYKEHRDDDYSTGDYTILFTLNSQNDLVIRVSYNEYYKTSQTRARYLVEIYDLNKTIIDIKYK